MKNTTLLLLSLLLLACGNKTGNGSATTPDASAQGSTTTPGTSAQGSASADGAITFDLHQDHINCTISAEPTGDTPWSPAVGEWLDERLGGCFDGDPRDLAALVDFYGKAKADTLRAAQKDALPDAELGFDAVMTKAYETDHIVTYTLSSFISLGGAHPLTLEEGATFRKSDGRRLDWNIVRKAMDMELNSLLRKSLMDYFGVASEEDLEPYLSGTDIYDIPLPHTPPYLLENGLAFIYQQYELTGYAMGMPADTIGYERIKPLLNHSIQRLIP